MMSHESNETLAYQRPPEDDIEQFKGNLEDVLRRQIERYDAYLDSQEGSAEADLFALKTSQHTAEEAKTARFDVSLSTLLGSQVAHLYHDEYNNEATRTMTKDLLKRHYHRRTKWPDTASAARQGVLSGVLAGIATGGAFSILAPRYAVPAAVFSMVGAGVSRYAQMKRGSLDDYTEHDVVKTAARIQKASPPDMSHGSQDYVM